jgi:hypothetical protein
MTRRTHAIKPLSKSLELPGWTNTPINWLYLMKGKVSCELSLLVKIVHVSLNVFTA